MLPSSPHAEVRRILGIVVGIDRHPDLIQAVEVMKDAQLEEIVLPVIVDGLPACFGELKGFGSRDRDVLRMKEVTPCCVQFWTGRSDIFRFGRVEFLVIETLRSCVKAQIIGEMLLDHLDVDSGCGRNYNLSVSRGLVSWSS